ncbi:LIC_10190 family membrane protein [Flavihumibacter profundi]|uniref:LIC_10190 family membrane protein n=1 Tax=Flavihumibacter profundi TaxID=2716883 RepID=UPI001CC6A3BA|nr:hypothetical protein [Flavihumibacter profundi]MBZ5859152.1 hypothetical protein [Flavihumibacter profundi]
MIQIIIAILYISLISWAWGSLALSVINSLLQEKYTNSFPIISLFGLSLIGILAQILSVFFAMGGWPIQVFLVLPLFILFLKNHDTLTSLKTVLLTTFRELDLIGILFLLSSIIFILVVGSWFIIHPDTLGYHAPIIAWNLKYPLVPGIANINGRLGLQSSWFILCALFQFDFTGTSALTFINSTVLSWFVLYLSVSLSRMIKTGKATAHLLLWLALCLASFGVSTMVYLAASSANPDFIICIFLWTSFYLLLTGEPNPPPASKTIMALILLAFSASLKLSALPVLLLVPFFYFLLPAMAVRKRILLLVVIPVLSILPFLFRNIIVSGYPLFPSGYFDFFHPDWKLSQSLAHEIDEYITAYARVGNVTIADYSPAMGLSVGEWLPIWWQQYALAEKLFIIAALLATLVNLIFLKKLLSQKNKPFIWIVLVCFICCVLLTVKAPAPRFSQAFLVPVILSAIYLASEKFPLLQLSVMLGKIALAAIFLVIISYDGYRLHRYFDTKNIWQPYGVLPTKLTTSKCQGMTIYLPDGPNGCGLSTVPCANNDCITFYPRGISVKEGFRPKPQ